MPSFRPILASIKVWIRGLPGVPGHLLRFLIGVITRFVGKNLGLMLAGAVAYNSLLSLLPLLALVLMLFSLFWETDALLSTIETELSMIIPSQADAISEVLADFMTQSEVIGIIGFAVLLFFSSIAFRILEKAMVIIFDMPTEKETRSFWFSALIPYIFITILGIGIVAITAATSLLEAIPREAFRIPLLDIEISIDAATSASFYISGLVGLVIIFTSVYLIIPLQKIALIRALIGGIVATFLWELVRHILVYYFTHLSFVNVIYGSLATMIIILLTLEVAAVILLLGAQVIADLERAARADAPWYLGPFLSGSDLHEYASPAYSTLTPTTSSDLDPSPVVPSDPPHRAHPPTPAPRGLIQGMILPPHDPPPNS